MEDQSCPAVLKQSIKDVICNKLWDLPSEKTWSLCHYSAVPNTIVTLTNLLNLPMEHDRSCLCCPTNKQKTANQAHRMPRYWNHFCSLYSLAKSCFCVVEKQNVWAKPQNPSVVSTDKMPLSKLPLGVRQSTLRLRKDTEEIKLKNTVMTLLRTQATGTAA